MQLLYLTALFKHIGSVEEPSTDEAIREKVINFVRDKVFPIKAELLKPQEEIGTWNISNGKCRRGGYCVPYR
ncbi:Apoptosis inhibitor 5 [Stylosanthes scabra]|uniref:Apoptosis inhibitor 5 n=1 Tax=Stylosanthes scabra TaxID=79078 RepID=A0ABU6U4N9_9FABA|nr:Apoptosis inhibitor 5 [Stylosanthes scabra]